MLTDIKDEPQIIKKLADLYLPKLNAGKPCAVNAVNADKISKIYIVASGSSRNAGNIARYFIESAAQIPVFAEYASEFSVRNPFLTKEDLVVFVSQSGETSDVLAALKMTKSKGTSTFAITNKEDSTLHKSCDAAMFIHAGTEKSIPATKSFIAQLIGLYILGIYLSEKKSCHSELDSKSEIYKEKIRQMPQIISKIIQNRSQLDSAAEKLFSAKTLTILGRGQNFGLAEEFALKVKETCYIAASGYPTGEFLHGHLAMLDETTPLFCIIAKAGITKDENYSLALSNAVQIAKKRNPPIFILKDSADCDIEKHFEEFNAEFININCVDNLFSPVYSSVVLHLLSFRMAELLGNDVNTPRSLSKTVFESN